MKRALIPLLLAPSLAGCASTINAIANMPITSDHIEGEGEKLKTLSGDRRLVRVSPEIVTLASGETRTTYRICAETQADAISARSARTDVNITGRGSIADASYEQLLLTYARTETSDVVRQLSWQLCNAWVNQAISPQQYREQLFALQSQAMEVLAARARPTPPPPPTPGATTPPPGAGDHAAATADSPCPAIIGWIMAACRDVTRGSNLVSRNALPFPCEVDFA